MELRPDLPLTVDYDFWQSMALETSPEFADSYLSGAEVFEGRLLPRTVTAWERLKDTWAATNLLDSRKIKLVKPPPYSPRMTQMAPRR